MFALIFSSCQTSLGPRTTTLRRRGADKTALFSYVWVSNCGGCPEPVWANLPFRISACLDKIAVAIICNLETHTNTHAVLCRVVRGRPWHYDGDNPAPYIDPVREIDRRHLTKRTTFLSRQAQVETLKNRPQRNHARAHI